MTRRSVYFTFPLGRIFVVVGAHPKEMETAADKDIPYALAAVGIALETSLAVYGACEGMVSAGAASVLCSQNRAILGPTYFIMIMISTIFFSGFLVSLIIATNLNDALTMDAGISYFSACMMVGVTAAISGKVCAGIGRNGFRVLSKKPTFLPILLILFGMVEFTIIAVLACALLLIYQQS